MCLSVDEVKVAVRGQVLILKHGSLSWSRPMVTAAPLVICLAHSHQDWRLELTQPLPGGPEAGLLHRMSSQHGADWSHAFLFQLTLFLCAALSLPLPQCLCLFLLVPLPPKKPQECCMAARKKKGHASFTVSPPLSAVPE